MKVGALGKIVFKVSSKSIKTVRSVTYKGSANYSVHSRVNKKGLVEYTGSAPEQISFSMRVSKSLGVSPWASISLLSGYVNSGVAVTFVLGSKKYGSYKWLVKSYDVKCEEFDKSGNLIGADIAVTLVEYVKG